MNKRQRAIIRIARDKERKALRHKELYGANDNLDTVFTMQHMVDALKKCKKGVNWKGSVQRYTQRAVVNMYSAMTDVRAGRIPPLTSVYEIILYERGKRRTITPITIKDRMTQRVLCDNALVPIITKGLIYDNGASMKGKGVDFARKRLEKHMAHAVKMYGKDTYALVFDFKSFFDSIPHMTCYNVLSRNFKDERIIDAAMTIIKSYQLSRLKNANDADTQKKIKALENNLSKGICLGSQISQILALAVPNPLDHYIKDECGEKDSMRYMDDGVVFGGDKEHLFNLLDGMKNICDELGLVFNVKKTRVVKLTRGFVFMKVHYQLDDDGHTITRLTHAGIVRQRRKLKKFRKKVDEGKMTLDDVYNSMQSWLAHTSVAMSYKTKRNMLALYNELFDGYRITKKWNHVKGGKNGELLQIDKWRDFRWDCNAA